MSKLKKRKKYSGNNAEFYGVEGCATNRAVEPVARSNPAYNDLHKRYTAGQAAPTNTSKPSNSGSNNQKIKKP